MTATQKLQGIAKAVLTRLLRPLDGTAWVGTAAVTFTLTGGLLAYHLWHRFRDDILAQPEYRLSAERLQVTAQPDWIQTDVKQSAVVAGRLRDANLLDAELVLQVKQAFGVQPWVRRVLRVNKRFPSTVEVDIEYRRPVAMVEVPAGMFPPYNYEGLLPVDIDGYLLPVEMSEEEAQEYPKIGGIDSSPAGPPGSPWGDPRVAEAAQIVQLLEPIWRQLELYRVVVPSPSSQPDAPTRAEYELVTRSGHHFAWGSAPGRERPGELPASAKVKGMRAWAEQHGALDKWDGGEEHRVSELSQRSRWQ